MPRQPFVVDAVFRFARECQIAAGYFIPPTDSLRVLTATWDALMTLPPVPTDPSAARRVFDAVVRLASHACHAQSYIANLPLSDTPVSASHQRAVQLLNLLLVKYYCPCLSLTELAQELDVSAPHLSELLRRASGYGFGTHLSGVRVLSAALLLCGAHASIAGIAHQCGYTQTAVLDHQFRQWLHASPTQFRRIVRRPDTPRAHNCVSSRRNSRQNDRQVFHFPDERALAISLLPLATTRAEPARAAKGGDQK
jgi:AraC-like DNA-binding protein